MLLDNAIDNEVTSNIRDTAMVESPDDMLGSIFVSDAAATLNEFDRESISEIRPFALATFVTDITKLFARKNGIWLEKLIDAESIPELLAETSEERVVEVMESAAISDDTLVDTLLDNNVMPKFLFVVLLKMPELVVPIIEYIFIPVDIAESISPIVSNVFGAPPTIVMTAALTAFDRLTASALIICEIIVSLATSDS